MATARASIHIDADPNQVWDVVGDPAEVSTFAPFIETSVVDGDIRVSQLAGGGTVRELIVSHVPAERRYVYAVQEAPFSLDHHQAEVRVEPQGDGSQLSWSVEVKPDELAARMQPNLDAIVEGAAALVAGAGAGVG